MAMNQRGGGDPLRAALAEALLRRVLEQRQARTAPTPRPVNARPQQPLGQAGQIPSGLARLQAMMQQRTAMQPSSPLAGRPVSPMIAGRAQPAMPTMPQQATRPAMPTMPQPTRRRPF